MRLSQSIVLGMLALLCSACEEEPRHPAAAPTPASAPTQKNQTAPVAVATPDESLPQLRAFLDEKKQVPAGLEWNREVTSRVGGKIKFRVDSQGPFAVTVVTGPAHKALMAGDKKPLSQSDLLLTVDSKGPTHEGTVTIPAGGSYFILENQAGKPVEFHLQCFPAS